MFWKGIGPTALENERRLWPFAKLLAVGIEPTTLGLLDPRSNQLSYASNGFLNLSQYYAGQYMKNMYVIVFIRI